MLVPLAIAIAGFLGYKSYKKTGHIPFLKGPVAPQPAEFTASVPQGFAKAAADFAPEDHAAPIVLPTVETRQAAITAKPSLTARVASGLNLIQPKAKV